MITKEEARIRGWTRTAAGVIAMLVGAFVLTGWLAAVTVGVGMTVASLGAEWFGFARAMRLVGKHELHMDGHLGVTIEGPMTEAQSEAIFEALQARFPTVERRERS